ncbi:hypothetical protein Ddc_23550 [Ditylenchus destructor]|nr:hypothetical protein Ddc_23550 [Ditylenchus destructor]
MVASCLIVLVVVVFTAVSANPQQAAQEALTKVSLSDHEKGEILKALSQHSAVVSPLIAMGEEWKNEGVEINKALGDMAGALTRYAHVIPALIALGEALDESDDVKDVHQGLVDVKDALTKHENIVKPLIAMGKTLKASGADLETVLPGLGGALKQFGAVLPKLVELGEALKEKSDDVNASMKALVGLLAAGHGKGKQ